MRKLRDKISGLKLNIKFTILIVIAFVIPIAFLAGVLYYTMEQNVIEENVTNLQYIMDRNESQIKTNIDSVNMSTQFTISDQGMIDVLNTAAEGKKFDTKYLMNFYETDIAQVERLVNNNPLLFGVRVYAANDNVQEMMPVLFQRKRMEKMAWASQENIYGWHFGYVDNLFESLARTKDQHLMGLVSEISDYKNGTIGSVEVVMNMGTMFPSLYEAAPNQYGVFIRDNGEYYTGVQVDDYTEALWNKVIESINSYRTQQEDSIKKTYFERAGKKRLVISYLYVKELNGTLIIVRDITSEVGDIYSSRTTFIVVAIAIIVILSFLVNGIVNKMLRQFYEILKTMQTIQDGELSARIEKCSGDEMGMLGTRLNEMLDEIQVLMQDGINREVLMKNTEIRALQNQINAHFIYNSLESIKMMAEIDEEYEISDAITALGKLLRYSMRWVSGNVLVEEELDYIQNYITLMNLRFDYKIILSINVEDEIYHQQIPKMSLQPIVENAIIHGIEEVAEDTTIYLKGYVQENDCYIEISDSGKGMTEEQVIKLKQKIEGVIEDGGGSGHGIGLKNVQDRINIAFGPEYGLDIASQINCFTKIIVHLPLIVEAREKL